jgi:hypothetical protein
MKKKATKIQTDVIADLVKERGVVSFDDVIKALKKNDPTCTMDNGLVHARIVKINELMTKLNELGSVLGTFSAETRSGKKYYVTRAESIFSYRVLPVTRSRSTKGRKIKKMKV